MHSREMMDAVFSLARVGLTELAKDMRNPPAVVAQHATILELWRQTVDNQMKEAEKLAADSKGKQ